jgi:hypothetical protein
MSQYSVFLFRKLRKFKLSEKKEKKKIEKRKAFTFVLKLYYILYVLVTKVYLYLDFLNIFDASNNVGDIFNDVYDAIVKHCNLLETIANNVHSRTLHRRCIANAKQFSINSFGKKYLKV